MIDIEHGSRKTDSIDNLITRKRGATVPDGYYALDVTSRSDKTIGRALSPFNNGHYGMTVYDDLKAYNIESAWQYTKVYAEHADVNGEPTEEYFKWRDDGFSHYKADRHPMGKGVKPLYSLWKGQHLGYIDARMNILVYLYCKEIVKTKAYESLKKAYTDGEKICILDFDAYNREKRFMTLKEVIEYPKCICGHGFMLEMLLRGIISTNENTQTVSYDWSKND